MDKLDERNWGESEDCRKDGRWRIRRFKSREEEVT